MPDEPNCDICGRRGWREDDGLMLCGPCWNLAQGYAHDDQENDR